MTPSVATETTGVAAEVLSADDRRFEAMRKGDWAALDRALADDLTYVHSTARLETKAEHIANLRAGEPHYRGISPRDRRVRVNGGGGGVNRGPANHPGRRRESEPLPPPHPGRDAQPRPRPRRAAAAPAPPA